MKITLPGQNIKIDSVNQVDPIWYERLAAIVAVVNLFSEVNPASLTNGQVLIWDATDKKFKPGSN